MEEKITFKKFTMNVLNGVALGTVLCLVPGALLGELLKYIAKVYPSLAFLSFFGYNFLMPLLDLLQV